MKEILVQFDQCTSRRDRGQAHMEINAQDSEGRDEMEVATAQEDQDQDQTPSPGITSCFHTLAMRKAELTVFKPRTCPSGLHTGSLQTLGPPYLTSYQSSTKLLSLPSLPSFLFSGPGCFLCLT